MSLGSGRVVAVDFARALAIWSMFIAHTAPSGGPLRLLNLSEYLTAPLFAALVGVGAALSDARSRQITEGIQRAGQRPNRLSAALIRGGVLVLLGVLLPFAGAHIVIVLVHLGVLTVLVVPAVRLPTWGVAITGIVAFVLSPPLMIAGRSLQMQLMTSESPLAAPASSLLDLAATSPSYRLSAFIVWACVGIILTRLLIAPAAPQRPSTVRHPSTGRLAVITVAFSGAFAGLFVVHKAGVFELTPYSGTHTELIFNTLMVCAALTGSLVLVRVLPRALSHAIGAVGQMAFTHYCLQILALAAWVRWVMPQDDSWFVMCGLIVGSCLVTALWRVVIRKQPWNRGIVEGGTDALVAFSRRNTLH